MTQYARHLLYEDPLKRFEVLALVWKDGQSTPLHDHDGTWGVEGVFQEGLWCRTLYKRNNLKFTCLFNTYRKSLFGRRRNR